MDIERCSFTHLTLCTGAQHYARPAHCGVFIDMAGAPIDAEMAETLQRGRLAEFIDMATAGEA